MWNILGNHSCVYQHGAIKIMFFALSFSILCRTCVIDRKEEIHQKTPSFRSFRMHWLLHCVDLTSRIHLLEADETPWKQRGLLITFTILYKVFVTLSFHSEGSALRRDSMSAYLFSGLVRYSAVTVIFSLITAPKSVWKDKSFVNFCTPHFQKVNQGHYQVHLTEYAFKKVFIVVSMQEVPVCLFWSSSVADSMSPQFLPLPRLSPPTCEWSFSSTKEAPFEIHFSLTLGLWLTIFSVPQFVAVEENDIRVLLGKCPKFLMSADLRAL